MSACLPRAPLFEKCRRQIKNCHLSMTQISFPKDDRTNFIDKVYAMTSGSRGPCPGVGGEGGVWGREEGPLGVCVVGRYLARSLVPWCLTN